jgi:hypothetical protein
MVRKCNLCCHYCRISANRKLKIKKRNYINCSSCNKRYCDYCFINRNRLNIRIESINLLAWKCACCTQNCCCSYDICKIKHTHCFTYKRTKDRHSKCSPLWKLKKKKCRKKISKTTKNSKIIIYNAIIIE